MYNFLRGYMLQAISFVRCKIYDCIQCGVCNDDSSAAKYANQHKWT
jgi:hypothetical protein